MDNVFRLGDFLFRCGFSYIDERYLFYLSGQGGKNERLGGSNLWNKDENPWKESKDKIIDKLDGWLKNISEHYNHGTTW
jgi:hypothetical protein